MGASVRISVTRFVEAIVGTEFIWGVNDCNIVAFRFASLFSLVPMPEFFDRILGTYSDAKEANTVFNSLNITVDGLFEHFGYYETEGKLLPGDIITFDIPRMTYRLAMPVVTPYTVLVAVGDVFTLRHISEISGDYKIYRRKE